MMTPLLASLIRAASTAGTRISSDAVADGHPETPESCLDFWLTDDPGDEEPISGAQLDESLAVLTADERAQVEAAFLRAARNVYAGPAEVAR